ncbi:MAG: NAD-dependent epimerase/dehydratase family protein [Proteobacteria bacterium]|jgi:UDP-glucose 4-epimerase|nr:NAD-dependent epimerase/dehydratase family protein [Pseudomonadota bacterium]
MSEDKKKVLIIGMAGGLAQITARLLLSKHPQWSVLGVDTRSVKQFTEIKGIETLSMKYSRGNFENLFRAHQFDAVLHLGRITHASNDSEMLAKRLELSVMGTNRILDLCLRSAVKKVVILSTFHVYGALPDNSIFLTEEAPLKASIKHPELRDVVEMDQMCGQFMWKHQQDLSTVMLRPCNIIGTQILNTMSRFLTSSMALRPIDYNPFFQFIHEFDMAQVLMRSLLDLPTGTYNVAGNEFIALREALDIVGSKGIPFPMIMAGGLNEVLKLANIDVPDYLIDYLKFSCLIDNQQLKKHLGEDFMRFGIKETLELIRLR